MSAVANRAYLVVEQVYLDNERACYEADQIVPIVDEAILEAVEAWTTGTCNQACESEVCCDFQLLSYLVDYLFDRVVED